jgi:type I restriction enzyme M protein
MILNDLFTDSKSQRSLALFEPKAIRAVEAMLTVKNGKHYLKCQVRNKEILVKGEEIVRQLWIHRLLNHYQYPVQISKRISVLRPGGTAGN